MPLNIITLLRNYVSNPTTATPSSPSTAASTQQLEPAVSSSNAGTPRVPSQHPQSDTSLVNAQASASTPRATLYYRLTEEETSRLEQYKNSGDDSAWMKEVKEIRAKCLAPEQSSGERFVTEQEPTVQQQAERAFLRVKPDGTPGILSARRC